MDLNGFYWILMDFHGYIVLIYENLMEISWGLEWFDSWILGNNAELSIQNGRTINNNVDVLRIQCDIQPKM